MQAEFDALQANDTWTLVPRPPGVNLVTGRWVSVTSSYLMALLTAIKPGGFFVVLHSVRKLIMMRLSAVSSSQQLFGWFTLALSRSWAIHQFDVKNAFLHGTLTGTVYCVQPTGFVDSSRPDYVCRLNKSLYGLKQTPHT